MQRMINALKQEGERWALVVILLIAAALRLYNVAWDGGELAHPDERSTVAFYAPTMHWPRDWSTAFDPKQSPFNPLWDPANQQRRSYTYGHFPLYVLTITANALHALAPLAQRLGASEGLVRTLTRATDIQGFAFVGRVLVALSDTATVYLVYLIARRLYGRGAALLAAALSAFTVLQIQLAHFFAVDPISTTFTLLALYGAMLMVERRTRGAAVLTGVGMGLAVASKFSALPILAAPVMAAWLISRGSADEERAAVQALAWRHCLLACLVAFVVFAVTSPFVILDWPNFVQAVIREQGAMVRGIADMPFTRQYRGTTPYVYFIEQQLRWGMGLPLGLVAFLGLAWVLVRALLRRAQAGELILLSWVVPYFGITGLFLAKFMRYMVPVVPLFTLMGAGLLERVSESTNRQVNKSASRGFADLQICRLADLLIVATLAGAVLWSLAFVNGVYGTEHTWITASRWIYENVPDGSVLAVEHWDDHLPLSLSEPGANMGAHDYRHVELPMYEEDTRQKYELLRDRLRQADYIVLSSNRLYRTIPRLPQRYPMSTRYYELLFSGQLGFEKVAEFTTYPRLGPVTIPDDAADESFTVYDHPKPIIFKKVRQLSDEEWDALLGGTWEGAVHGYVGRPTLLSLKWLDSLSSSPAQQAEGEEDKTLLLDRPVDELPVVADFGWNDLASRSTPVAVLVWWLVVTLIGALAWPLTFVVFRHLADRGHVLARSLGLIVLAYLVWLPASLRWLRNGLPLTLAAMVVLAAVSAFLLRRHRQAIFAFWRERWRIVAFEEIWLLAAFLLFVFIRILNPDLWQPWQGGEKSMDIAYLNACLRSAYLPPYDPYYAHGYLNYYYYGQFVISLVVRLTGILPTVAFNLAVPMLFALTVGNAFGVGYSLARGLEGNSGGTRRNSGGFGGNWGGLRGALGGLLAAGFVTVIGNLDSLVQIVTRLGERSGSAFQSSIPGLEGLVKGTLGLWQVLRGAQPFPGFNYWTPSRVIPFTINEFPYWSFLFADLHPHMMAIPFTILVVALALEVLLEGWKGGSLEGWRGGRVGWARYVVLPICLGALGVINTWDLPTYLGLMGLVLLLRWRRKGWNAVLLAVTVTGLLGVLSLLLYRPFFAYYKALFVGIDFVKARTEIGPFLRIWGLFLFLVISLLLVDVGRQRARLGILRFLRLLWRRWEVLPHFSELYSALVRQSQPGYRLALYGLVGMLGLLVLLAVAKLWVFVLLIPLLVLAVLLLGRDDATPAQLFVHALIFTALLILLGIEVVYLKDFLGGSEWQRMNTVFKFGIQVWVLLGLATGAALPGLWAAVGRWRSRRMRGVWTGVLALLLFAACIYPVVGTPARVDDRFPGARPPLGTLDGMAYMTVGEYAWPDESNRIALKYDYEAIRWLMKNVKGTPVVAEAAIGYYREFGMRVASYTGLPTLLGALHQSEQRYSWQVSERDDATRNFFNTTDLERTRQLIRDLHIRYVYIGQLERTVYDPAGLQKFDQLVQTGEMRVVYRNERTTIYECLW
ncbi:MAG: glycosyltransferase family 39 protein [Anaerolineae bacterium]|nr:glycosyltransferase family 39 protein [Anaerolineae bacterium]